MGKRVTRRSNQVALGPCAQVFFYNCRNINASFHLIKVKFHDFYQPRSEGNAFTPVSHSVHRGRGGVPACTWAEGWYPSMHLGGECGQGCACYTPPPPPGWRPVPGLMGIEGWGGGGGGGLPELGKVVTSVGEGGHPYPPPQ